MQKCDVCGEEFKNARALRYHKQKVHGDSTNNNDNDGGSENLDLKVDKDEKTYECSECGASLSKGQEVCPKCGEPLSWEGL